MAFFCFRKKYPWSKTNQYNCNGEKQKHKTTKAGAVDEVCDAYEKHIGVNGKERFGLDRHGRDAASTNGLRRSKKKHKKLKVNERSQKPVERVDERSRLANILDNSNEDSQVEIITTLVDSFGPAENCQFEVLPGEKVIARYRSGDFIKITRPDGEAGFVPVKICFLVAENTSHVVKERYGSTPSIKSTSHGSTPSVKSTSPVCNGVNMKSSTISLQKSLEPSLNPEIADEAGSNSAVDGPTKGDGEVENRPMPSAMLEMNDAECDSLARRVKRHEIRQLLKRETSQKMLSSNNSIQKLTNEGKSDVEISTETKDGPNLMRNGEKDGVQTQYDSEKVAILQQTPFLQNSNLSLNSKSDCATQKGTENTTSSRLSINSIHKDTRGSQQSLSSLRSKNSSLTAGSMPSQSKARLIGLTPRYFAELQQARFDSQSISSYDGSLQEIYSKLNGDFSRNPQKASEGFFYQRNNSPEFSGQRLIDLQYEPPFHGSRRCTSLRRGGNYAWFPQNYLNGFGHGRLVEDERALNYFAEHMPTAGPRFNSPLWYENLQIMGESSNLGNETTMFAMRDFQAVEEDELSLRKGERVSLVKKDSEEWWWVLNNRGERGLVPSYFLIPLLQPSRQDNGVLIEPRYGMPNAMHMDPSHSAPYMNFGADRRMQELLVRYGIENERRENEKTNGLTRSNTIGSDIRGSKGSRIDWRKVYNTENGPRGLSNLKDLNTARDNMDDVKAKEELLHRIRNEVKKDPMKDLARKKSLSNENMHKISITNEGTERFLQETLRRRDLIDNRLDIGDSHTAAEKENMPRSLENVVALEKQQVTEKQLPSYEQCVDQLSRGQRNDATNSSVLSTANSDLFETPRILRRRLTYSGGASRKVRFNAARSDCEEKLKNDDSAGVKPEGKADDGISTWC